MRRDGGGAETSNLIGIGQGLKVFELENEIGVMLWEE